MPQHSPQTAGAGRGSMITMAGNTRQRRAGSRTGRHRTVRPAPAAGDRKRGDPGTDGSQTLPWRRQSRANPSLKPKFPASRQNTGNFIDSGLGRASTVEKTSIISIVYEPIPYASEQGI